GLNVCHWLWHNSLLKHPDFYINSKSAGSCLGWHTGLAFVIGLVMSLGKSNNLPAYSKAIR
ncbi:hypothetical protein, partial [Oceanisphaera marina]|uniref:hypothetical protein n=1 Tax=Oceanisphaera marina TaxID=2017550 RepID=UPI001E58FC3D